MNTEVQRLHYMDNLRALAMMLGIFFHAAIAYHPMMQNLWLSASNEHSVMLEVIAWFTHLFRMPLFFVVAGFSFLVLELAGRKVQPWLQFFVWFQLVFLQPSLFSTSSVFSSVFSSTFWTGRMTSPPACFTFSIADGVACFTLIVYAALI